MDKWPHNIDEVIWFLSREPKKNTHIDLIPFQSEKSVDPVSRSMVGLANIGGGLIILGLYVTKDNRGIVMGLPRSAEETINHNLREFVKTRCVNVEYSYTLFFFQDRFLAAIWVNPANGLAYLLSAKDKDHRTIYYGLGTKPIIRKFSVVYKYMTLDAFIASLENGKWRFCEPTMWKDKYESRFYCAKYHLLTKTPDSVQRVYASCVTRTKNNEAAWKVYAGKDGMKSHCVQLTLNVSALLDHLNSSNMKVYEKPVMYEEDRFISELHKSDSVNHRSFFGDFNFNKFLDLLSLKRKAYEYENEIRYFVVKQDMEPIGDKGEPEVEDLPMEWKNVISMIRIDKNCTDSELIALRYSCWRRGIRLVFSERNLPGEEPQEITALEPIEAELFDIDAMPGGGKDITIEPVSP